MSLRISILKPVAVYSFAAACCLMSGMPTMAAGQQPDASQPAAASDSAVAQTLDAATSSSDGVAVETAIDEDLSHWQYSAEIELPSRESNPADATQNADLIDFFLNPDMSFPARH
jgi:hypothetical protein